MTLIEFLRARVNDDEELANERATGQPIASEPWSLYRCYGGSLTVRSHWIDVDPTRVLAECRAKRLILDAVEGGGVEDADPRAAALADVVLSALALPYAGHPDYLPRWSVPGGR